MPSLQIRSSFCLRQSISIQSLLEALTDGTARAVTKRNNASVVCDHFRFLVLHILLSLLGLLVSSPHSSFVRSKSSQP